MVLIQLLLPTSSAASADGLAPLAATQRELAARSTGSRPIFDHRRRDYGLLTQLGASGTIDQTSGASVSC